MSKSYCKLYSYIYALFLCIQQCVLGSIYTIESSIWIPPFQHAEKMFATNKGPLFASSGASSINFNISAGNLTETSGEWRLVVLMYHVANYDMFAIVEENVLFVACTDRLTTSDTNSLSDQQFSVPGMSDIQIFSFPIEGTSVNAIGKYDVETSGWIDTRVYICSQAIQSASSAIGNTTKDDDDAFLDEAATDLSGVFDIPFEGTLEIQNPYGYLPAVLYGMLPFSLFLTIGYLLLDCIFIVLLIKHRQQALPLHTGILFVLVMGTITSGVWLFAFESMNVSGQPVCCPYPQPFLVAVCMDALVRTLARILLLVVCLGYGIVHASLSKVQVVFLVILSLAYLSSGVADEILRGTSSGANFRDQPSIFSFIQLLCNLTFIMWIHYSLEAIMKNLDNEGQSAKLKMYRQLAWSLAAFILFFTILTVVAVCSRLGMFEWDVEWEWMQLVAWPVLNFIVSAAMTIIWRPTKYSSQFAFSMQLPTSEDDSHGLESAEKKRQKQVQKSTKFNGDEDVEDLFDGLDFDDDDDVFDIDLSENTDHKNRLAELGGMKRKTKDVDEDEDIEV